MINLEKLNRKSANPPSPQPPTPPPLKKTCPFTILLDLFLIFQIPFPLREVLKFTLPPLPPPDKTCGEGTLLWLTLSQSWHLVRFN